MRLKTTNGYEFQVDDEELDKISGYHWYAHRSRYRLRSGETRYNVVYIVADVWENGVKRCVRLHRLILGAQESQGIDHINGNGLDNRKVNLRLCTQSQNMANVSMWRSNTSGRKGVSWDKNKELWQAKITVNNKQKHLGRFDSLEKAAAAYDRAAEVHFGEFSQLNTEE